MAGKLRFQLVDFVTTAASPEGYPKSPLPEIAVAGRSNVGKSTLLNHLFKRKNLVKTSTTPGKTRTIQFFNVDDQTLFADLPGYGYAKVPKGMQREWGKLIEHYLTEREELKLLLFLCDIRRTPKEEDHQLLEWAQHHGLPMILILTKADKLKRGEQQKQQKLIRESLGDLPTVLYSATKNVGRHQLINAIEEVMWGS